MTLTYAEHTKRRKTIADECLSQFLEDVASCHGVSFATARNACREHNVVFKRRRVRRSKTKEDAPFLFAVLRDLLDGGWGLSEIAARHGITAQRVSQIETMAMEADLLNPRRWRTTDEAKDEQCTTTKS
jgi:hypothetical protein